PKTFSSPDMPSPLRGNAPNAAVARAAALDFTKAHWTSLDFRRASRGWGGRIRTSGSGIQSPVPYHLATPQDCDHPPPEPRDLTTAPSPSPGPSLPGERREGLGS